ncbi:MAG: hypothetical protein C9356_20230 [Oleiphilus sp.]|nr:MAG: hypothetical protein C9356_20230 [Oleiphilus sp.]
MPASRVSDEELCRRYDAWAASPDEQAKGSYVYILHRTTGASYERIKRVIEDYEMQRTLEEIREGEGALDSLNAKLLRLIRPLAEELYQAAQQDKQAQLDIFMHERREAEEIRARLQQEKNALQEQHRVLTAKLADRDQSIAELHHDIDGRKEDEAVLNTRIGELETALSAEKKHSAHWKKVAKEHLELASQHADNLMAKDDAHRKERRDLQQQHDTALITIEHQLNATKEKLAQREETLDKMKRTVATTEKALKAARQEVSTLTHTCQHAKEQHTQQAEALDTLQQQLNTTGASLAEKEAALTQAHAQLSDTQSQLQAARAQCEQLTQQQADQAQVLARLEQLTHLVERTKPSEAPTKR